MFYSPTTATDIIDNSVEVYGAELHYLEAGQGSMLILLHGLGGNAWEWNQTILSLAKSFYVIALDQIGFGDSDKPFLNYRINTFVDFLYGFYRGLGIRKASIIGHDIGGWIAAALALKHPDLVERLVLVGTNPFNTLKQKRIKKDYNPVTCQQTLEQLQRLFYQKNRFVNWQVAEQVFTQKIAINDGYTIEQLTKSIYKNQDVLDNCLAELTAPTLIIQGKEDEFVPLTVSQRLHREIKNSKLQILDKCGHLPHVEQSKKFILLVNSFFNNHSLPDC